jgi:hypothetical protein
MYTHVNCGVEAGKELWICKLIAHAGLGLLGLHVNATTSTPIIIYMPESSFLGCMGVLYSLAVTKGSLLRPVEARRACCAGLEPSAAQSPE